VSNYTQITDFSAKDALASGDANKKILGSDMDAELAAISTAIATKGDDSGLVHTTGTETVAGDKTLSGNNTHSGTNTVSGALNVSGITTHTNKVVMTSKPVWLAEGASVASASDCDIWAAGDGNTVHVTGTTTITDWGTAPQAGAWMRVVFDGALQLTYNATTNALPTSANITTAAGDSCIVYADSTSAYSVYDYTRQNGKPLVDYETGGMVLLESGTKSAAATNSWVMTSYTGYANKLLRIRALVVTTDAVTLAFKVSTDGGSSYDGGASDYSWLASVVQMTAVPAITATDVGDNADTDVSLTGDVTLGNDAGFHADFDVTLLSTTSASQLSMKWDGTMIESVNNLLATVKGAARRLASQDTDAVQIAVSSGTIACSYELYGWN